jgi:hypothetical protein
MLHEAKIIELTPDDRRYLKRYYETSNPSFIASVWDLHPDVFRSNVFNLRPPPKPGLPNNSIEAICGGKSTAIGGYPALTKGKYVDERYVPEIERLGDELFRHNPNLILCLGNTAMWALLGQTAISRYRGTTAISTHCATGFKVLPTYHPAAVLRQWDLRPIVVLDLAKARRESHTPSITRPARTIHIPETLEDCLEWWKEAKEYSRIAVDIETYGQQITCIGFAAGPSNCLVIPIHDGGRVGGSYWATQEVEVKVWGFIREVLGSSIPKVFQNGMYDISFLWRAYGIKTMRAEEDTMLLHHALQPESLKGLGFLGSVYTDEGSWKHLRRGKDTIKEDD